MRFQAALENSLAEKSGENSKANQQTSSLSDLNGTFVFQVVRISPETGISLRHMCQGQTTNFISFDRVCLGRCVLTFRCFRVLNTFLLYRCVLKMPNQRVISSRKTDVFELRGQFVLKKEIL